MQQKASDPLSHGGFSLPSSVFSFVFLPWDGIGIWTHPVSFQVPPSPLSTDPRSSICLGLGQRSGRPPPQSSSWAVQRSSYRKGDTERRQESNFQLFAERLSAALPESLPELELPALLLPRLSGCPLQTRSPSLP